MNKGVSHKCRRMSILALVFMVLGLMGMGQGQAYDLPLGLNLGFTSFLDGGPPAGPGLYYTHYLQYIHADKFLDANGNKILSGVNLDVLVSLSQFIYQTKQELVPAIGMMPPARFGLDVIIPVVAIDFSHDGGGPPEDSGAGFGDILVGPYLQWDPIIVGGRPVFMHRIEFQMIFPTGKYDSNKELNPGSNFFSFDPYWAATVFFTPRWTASWRVHYLLNAQNDDPNRAFGPIDNTQAGQAVHLNFASDYEVLENKLRVGINGYYLKQVTDMQANGIDLSGTREQVLALGPGAVFHYSKDTHFFFNFYAETAVENRPEGYRFNFRYVHHF
jgi:hypothetical protein